MDPELAFIQANLALIHPGTLALDPFCGTGGLLLSAAHFGAHVIGLEIKWDVAKAKVHFSDIFTLIIGLISKGKSSRAGEEWLTKEQSVRANFQQYGLDDGRFLGIFLADSSQHGMWKMADKSGEYDGMVDAILADRKKKCIY
jgi:tRNA (guanine10-N2)-methyltransferase